MRHLRVATKVREWQMERTILGILKRITPLLAVRGRDPPKVILSCYMHPSCMTAADEPLRFVLRIFGVKSRAHRGGSQRTVCCKLQIVVDADRIYVD